MHKKIKEIMEKVSKGELTPAEGLQQIAEAIDAQKADAEAVEALKAALEELKGQLDGDDSPVAKLEKTIKDLTAKVNEVRITGGGPRNDDTGKHGFKHVGEFAQALKASNNGQARNVDERLLKGKEVAEQINKAAAGDPAVTSESADVGYIPPDFSRELWNGALDESNLMSLCDRREAGGNSVVDQVNKAQGAWSASGVQAYWENEAAAITQSKPEFEPVTRRLNKLTVLVPVSEESLEDAPYLASEIMAEGRDKISWKTDEAIVNGTGVGQPLGILHHTAGLVTVAKKSGQAADTFVQDNVSNMWARVPSAWKRRNCVWLTNDDVLPQLDTLAIGDQPVYIGPRGLRDDDVNGMLKGRPVVAGQHCQTLGDKGDVVLAAMGMYKLLTKAGGIQTASSMHLWFDQALTAFRLIFRAGGYPKLVRTVAPHKGNKDLSAFVTLAERA